MDRSKEQKSHSQHSGGLLPVREKELKGIRISYISQIDIDNEKHQLDSLWKNILPIKEIQARQHFKFIDAVRPFILTMN